MNRRNFLKSSLLVAAGATFGNLLPAQAASADSTDRSKQLGRLVRKGSGFTMWQLNTQNDLIGNSYIFVTDRGRVIVMDGGFAEDELYLRGFLCALGGKVDTWFVSHPHVDHMGSLTNILSDPRGITVGHIYHSRFPEDLIVKNKPDITHCRNFYAALDNATGTQVTDLQQPGLTGSIDGFHFKILSTTCTDFHHDFYNNNSMIIRVWDNRKSLVFLGDMGKEAGEKMLLSPYKKDLDCDYLQMAHHGQWACTEDFYRALQFKACLWSTPHKFWDNIGPGGPGTGIYQVPLTRKWMERKGITEHHVSWQGLWKLD